MKIEILDTTLRDGAQGVGVEFSPDDRRRVIRALDRLGVSCIEAGMVTDDNSAAFFDSLKETQPENAKLAVFTRTALVGTDPDGDPLLRMAADAPVPLAVIYGKSWLHQVTDVLGTTPEENLRLIRESIRVLRDAGKEVVFDAEHFFSGWADSPEYATRVVDTAFEAGAATVVLCDTNGGMLPDVVGMVTEAVVKARPGRKIGIHCHNDLGMAAAATVSAVLAGACHVQGTVSGVGERCGNADLCTVIPVLQLKLGFDCLGSRIAQLTETARTVCDAANLSFDESAPFVGGYAFTHKAGTHIDGVRKDPSSFEHMDPASVGNARNTVVSGLSGRAAVLDRLRALLPDADLCGDLSKNDPRVIRAANLIREKEAQGFDYEDAAASLTLALEEALGRRRRFFELLSLKVVIDEPTGEETAASPDAVHPEEAGLFSASAVIKIAVGDRAYLTAGEGNGPVNAIDEALRRALLRFYPELEAVRLTDYRVRVLDSRATASAVRVAIESTDGRTVWRTVGVSSDIINASWQALRDSVEFALENGGKPALPES
jgi:2-isopropylmalate synthase